MAQGCQLEACLSNLQALLKPLGNLYVNQSRISLALLEDSTRYAHRACCGQQASGMGEASRHYTFQNQKDPITLAITNLEKSCEYIHPYPENPGGFLEGITLLQHLNAVPFPI